MRSRTVPCALVCTLLVLGSVGCSSGGSSTRRHQPSGGSSLPSTTLSQKPVRFSQAACPVTVPTGSVRVTCGWLRVPENRLVADSPTIELAVAWMHTAAKNPGAPVVDLGGGPGFPSVQNVPKLVKSKILTRHDFIVWDQRGIGFSKPNLDCPEYGKAAFQMLDTTDPPAVEGARVDKAVGACRTRLVKTGVDLSGFTTTQNAADLADLRVALKIPEWNLHAASYGTALALEELRTHPDGIRSVLLDSVVPPDAAVGALDRAKSAQRAYDALVTACAKQPTCHDKYGDLGAVIAKAAASLDADPYRTEVTDDSDGSKHQMTVTGTDLYAGLFQALYNPTLITAIPTVMRQIADGNRGIIASLASSAVPLATGSSTGMMLSINCADRQRLFDAAGLKAYLKDHPQWGTAVYLSASENQCPIWDVPSVPKAFNAMPRPTSVPVLVTAGAFDPITPPAGSKAVADALGAPFLEFPDAGHGAVGPSQCSIDIWFAFMADPKGKLDTSCIADLKTITLN